MKPPSAIRTGTSIRTTATSPPGLASATASGMQPPPATDDDPWSCYLPASLSAERLADRRKIIGVIDHAVQHGDSVLDFQHLSATALKAVPVAALNALARQVNGVTLPAGLDALPRCLNQLTELRSIEMAMCKARQIDVTAWNLDTLTVTGLTKLRWIDANEGTIVNCPAPGIRRKVCVNVYRDGQLLGHTAAGSRRYIKVPARRQINVNGRFTMLNGERAFCRHIAKWWFGARAARRADKVSGAFDPASDMYAVLGNASSFRQAVGDDAGNTYADAVANATRNILVGNDWFGKVIQKEFRLMAKGALPAIRRFHVTSITHAMGLELTVKDGRNGKPEYSVVFYDPNVSETHLRLKYHRARETRDLTLTSLFPRPDLISEYFGKQAPVVILTDLDSTQSGKKRSLRVMLTVPEACCPFALDLAMGHKFEATANQLINGLRAMPAGTVNWKAFFHPQPAENCPLVLIAVDNDLPQLARRFLELSIKLSAEGALDDGAVFKLLRQESPIPESPDTALSLACKLNDCEFIELLTDVLVQDEADGLAGPAEYEDLLRNGGTGQPSPYAIALQQDVFGAAIVMVESMLRLTAARRITHAQFVRLVACRDSDGVPAIEQAFGAGDAERVLALMQPVISTATFSASQMCEMLAAARADGTPALRATYRAEQANFLAAYGRLVLSTVSAQGMEPADAIAILLASKPDETPFEALQAIAPRGEMLHALDDLLHDVRVARWLPDDLSKALDALHMQDAADVNSSDIDPDSELSSLE